MNDACFVCHEAGGTLYSVCQCNVRVHAACFRATVRTVPAHAHACPVCTHVYWHGTGGGAVARLVMLALFNLATVGVLLYCYVARSPLTPFFLLYAAWNAAETHAAITTLTRHTVVLGAAMQQRYCTLGGGRLVVADE